MGNYEYLENNICNASQGVSISSRALQRLTQQKKIRSR